MTPGFFSGLVMMFLMRKKRGATRFYEWDGVEILGQTAPTKTKFLKLTRWFAWIWTTFGLVRRVRTVPNHSARTKNNHRQGRPRPAGNSSNLVKEYPSSSWSGESCKDQSIHFDSPTVQNDHVETHIVDKSCCFSVAGAYFWDREFMGIFFGTLAKKMKSWDLTL